MNKVQECFLNEFTKQEIITWIKGNFHFIINPPKKSDLLFIRWQINNEKLDQKHKESSEMLDAIDMRERDRLAEQFNNSNDTRRRLKILKKMKPIDAKFEEWSKFHDQLMKLEKKNRRIYDSIYVERKKEKARCA